METKKQKQTHNVWFRVPTYISCEKLLSPQRFPLREVKLSQEKITYVYNRGTEAYVVIQILILEMSWKSSGGGGGW